MKITMNAHAKINLTLDVTGRLPNGYHTVKMLMQTVGLHDIVTVETTNHGKTVLTTNLKFLPTDGGNLAVRAANAFFTATGLTNTGLRIHVEKRIPVAAGLAGGSTDAAAVLKALNTLYSAGLSDEQLCAIGLKLGADVPYCILGGTMLAEGIGEKLTRVPDAPHCFVVLCKPPFSVSTPAIYAEMDMVTIACHPDTAGMLAALREGSFSETCHRLYNVMEPVTGAHHAAIGEIRRTLIDAGADGAIMSGSGPTVFGLFADKTAAHHAYDLLKPRYRETHLTEIYHP